MRKFRYSLSFLFGSIMIFLFLILGTVHQTLDDIWREEQRYYDTKWEYFALMFGPQWLKETVYDTAEPKIPDSDFEQEVWRYRTYTYPMLQSVVENPSIGEGFVSEITRVLISSESYQSRSAIVRDVEKFIVLEHYALFFFTYTKRYDKKEFQANYREVLASLAQSATQITSSNFTAPYTPSAREEILEFILTSYILLKSHIFLGSTCDEAVASAWMELSAQIRQLISMPEVRREVKPTSGSRVLDKLEEEIKSQDTIIKTQIDQSC